MLEDFMDDVKVVDDNYIVNLPLAKEFAWDFDNNKYILENGNIKTVTGNEAIAVWCYFALKTDRYVHEIYSWNYGSEIYNLIGQKYSPELTKSEAKRYIKEALLINRYITNVDVVRVDFKGSKLYIDIVLNTVYGRKEVNMNV